MCIRDRYYSTNKQAPDVTLEEAVVKGLAADKGLFMPFTIKPLDVYKRQGYSGLCCAVVSAHHACLHQTVSCFITLHFYRTGAALGNVYNDNACLLYTSNTSC